MLSVGVSLAPSVEGPLWAQCRGNLEMPCSLGGLGSRKLSSRRGDQQRTTRKVSQCTQVWNWCPGLDGHKEPLPPQVGPSPGAGTAPMAVNTSQLQNLLGQVGDRQVRP